MLIMLGKEILHFASSSYGEFSLTCWFILVDIPHWSLWKMFWMQKAEVLGEITQYRMYGVALGA